MNDVANTISFGMAAFNFQGAVVAAHIHKALVGVNGPVQYNLLSNADSSGLIFAIPNSFGFSSGAKPVGLTLADDINATPWNYYVNVHTTAFGGGEICDQITARFVSAKVRPCRPHNEKAARRPLKRSPQGRTTQAARRRRATTPTKPRPRANSA